MATSMPSSPNNRVETMTEENAELGLNEDSIHSDIISLSDGIITKSMLTEEKILLEQTAEENKRLAENNSKENEFSAKEHFKQLQHLLGRSKFYSKYLQSKITDAQKKDLHKKTKQKSTVKQEKHIQEPLRTRSAVLENTEKVNTNSLKQSPVNLKRCSGKDSNTRALKIPKLELRRLEDCYPENYKECPIATFTQKSLKPESSDEEVPSLLTGGVLRSYQLEGYNWLKVLYENGINGILGDEMGLGKTIQCISLIAHLIEHGVTGPFLICSPLSTLPNWVAEFQRFTPKIPVILYHGSKDERAALQTKFRKCHTFDGFSALPVIITSYEIVIRDFTTLGHYKWKYLIVDEGHRIKNMNCLLIKRLKTLHSVNRLLLTGTPLQNNLAELWSLLNFILPELFDDLKIFESWFEVKAMTEEGNDERIIALEQENHILATLHEILVPFLLRRVKTDVELFIPPKRELIVYAPLTLKQQTYYKAIVDKNIHNVVGNQVKAQEIELPKKRRPNLNSKPAYETHATLSTHEINRHLLQSIMQFRKCVNHPYLFEYPLDPATQGYLINEDLVAASGKILVLDVLVKKLIENDHKILIFSQMVKMLDIIHDFCYLRNYRFVRLDGSKGLSERQDAIKQFNENPDIKLFLLSTRAGGLGLNLTTADTVIIYDSDWNPQCDLQAMDRCHRIGQTKPVVVYRLVTENTIDQSIVTRAAAKRKLEKMVIHKDKFTNGVHREQRLSAISPKELLELLKSTDHDGVVSSNKKEVFTKEELDMLLDRSFKSKQRQRFPEASHSRVKVMDEEATQPTPTSV